MVSMTIDKIEIVTEFNHLQIRELKNDGTFHRRVLTPDMDLTQESAEIKAIAAQNWTDKIKSDWAQKLIELNG